MEGYTKRIYVTDKDLLLITLLNFYCDLFLLMTIMSMKVGTPKRKSL